MACMTALFEVAKARPKFMSQVMQAFRELHSTLPPTLSQSQVNSVKKHMKMQVINLIRYTSSLDMIPQLIQLLSDFGMSNTAIKKFLPKDKRLKRILDTYNGDGPAKRARIDSPQANSQGSDSLSNDENLMDSNKVTEKSLLEGLENIDNVINLVLATMDRLPNEIPGNFKTVYEPIPKTGTLLPKSALAKLLLNIIKNDPVEKRPFAEVAVKADEEKKSNLKSALAKLGTAMQESKNDSNDEEMESRTDGEIAREKEISKNLPKDKMICPPTPTIPKLKQRAKSIKLTEVTKPISTDMKEKLIYGAVERILNSERASIESGATNQRIKMITSFAVSYGLKVRELVLGHILKDLPSQIDLALYWLFEEYSYMQGFNRSAGNLGSSKPHDKLGQNYNQLFCALVTHIADLNDPSLEIVQENLWRRVYLESPYVTDDGLQFLKHLCMQENKSVSSMKLLRDLAIYQPPKSAKYIHRFLTLVSE